MILIEPFGMPLNRNNVRKVRAFDSFDNAILDAFRVDAKSRCEAFDELMMRAGYGRLVHTHDGSEFRVRHHTNTMNRVAAVRIFRRMVH